MLLAWHDQKWVANWLERFPLPDFTARITTDRAAFLRELKAIRERGYAVSKGEYEMGIETVAAPLTGEGGEALAAINVSGPESMFLCHRMHRVLVPAVLEVAHETSKALM